jgi:hypothetical protein
MTFADDALYRSALNFMIYQRFVVFPVRMPKH